MYLFHTNAGILYTSFINYWPENQVIEGEHREYQVGGAFGTDNKLLVFMTLNVLTNRVNDSICVPY